MQEHPIQSKDTVSESSVADPFERLRRERKEQSATERILNWFCLEDTLLDPFLVSPTPRRYTRSSRPPLRDIPNHNSSALRTLRYVGESAESRKSNEFRESFLKLHTRESGESGESPLKQRTRGPSWWSATTKSSLKRKAPSPGPQRQEAEDSTGLRAGLSSVMDNIEDAVPSSSAPRTPSPRKRGRPKKNVAVEEHDPTVSMGHEMKKSLSLSSLSIDPVVFSPQSQEDISLSRPRSPSKTGTSTAKTASTITKKELLLHLTPPVEFLTLENVKDVGGLPEMANQLWLKHVHPAISETRVIPAYLEDQLITASNTPMRSKPRIATNSFGPVIHYDTLDRNLVWLTVSDVVFMTGEYRNRGTEAHWSSVVVNPLLQLVRRLTKFQKGMGAPMLEVLDITTVEISPRSLCPSAEHPALFKELNKRIDCAIGLRLSPTERHILGRGRFKSFSTPSINQTSAFVNMTPMFVNIEVKRAHSNQDPLIQLGVWIVAEFKKRQIEGYSLDMPVLAIAVVEENWDLYIVYAAINDGESYGCNFVGPLDMGSTKSVEGTFKILGILCSLVGWGLSDYRAWFEEEILAKYKV